VVLDLSHVLVRESSWVWEVCQEVLFFHSLDLWELLDESVVFGFEFTSLLGLL
jgi:hypothetical protein